MTAPRYLLHSAISNTVNESRPDIVKRALGEALKKETLNEVNQEGYTPLMLAAKLGHSLAVDFLLDKHTGWNFLGKIDFNVSNSAGETALSLALQNPQPQYQSYNPADAKVESKMESKEHKTTDKLKIKTNIAKRILDCVIKVGGEKVEPCVEFLSNAARIGARASNPEFLSYCFDLVRTEDSVGPYGYYVKRFATVKEDVIKILQDKIGPKETNHLVEWLLVNIEWERHQEIVQVVAALVPRLLDHSNDDAVAMCIRRRSIFNALQSIKFFNSLSDALVKGNLNSSQFHKLIFSYTRAYNANRDSHYFPDEGILVFSGILSLLNYRLTPVQFKEIAELFLERQIINGLANSSDGSRHGIIVFDAMLNTLNQGKLEKNEVVSYALRLFHQGEKNFVGTALFSPVNKCEVIKSIALKECKESLDGQMAIFVALAPYFPRSQDALGCLRSLMNSKNPAALLFAKAFVRHCDQLRQEYPALSNAVLRDDQVYLKSFNLEEEKPNNISLQRLVRLGNADLLIKSIELGEPLEARELKMEISAGGDEAGFVRINNYLTCIALIKEMKDVARHNAKSNAMAAIKKLEESDQDSVLKVFEERFPGQKEHVDEIRGQLQKERAIEAIAVKPDQAVSQSEPSAPDELPPSYVAAVTAQPLLEEKRSVVDGSVSNKDGISTQVSLTAASAMFSGQRPLEEKENPLNESLLATLMNVSQMMSQVRFNRAENQELARELQTLLAKRVLAKESVTSSSESKVEISASSSVSRTARTGAN